VGDVAFRSAAVNVSRETVQCAACLLFGAGGRRGVFFKRFGVGFVEAEDENAPPSLVLGGEDTAKEVH